MCHLFVRSAAHLNALCQLLSTVYSTTVPDSLKNLTLRLMQQQEGFQASIRRFTKTQQKADNTTANQLKPKKKGEASTLLKLLSNSGSRGGGQDRRRLGPQTAALLSTAVTAAAPSRRDARATQTQRHSSNADTEATSRQQTEACASPHKQPAAEGKCGGASSLQACPLCGVQLPVSALQQHLDDELAGLDAADSSQQEEDHHTDRQLHGSRPFHHQQQQQQTGMMQRHAPAKQQQHQQPYAAQHWPAASSPEVHQVKRHRTLPQPQHSDEAPWQQHHHHLQQQQQQPWQSAPQHSQRLRHGRVQQQQQQRTVGSRTPSLPHTSVSRRPPCRPHEVKSLSAAPRCPTGPQGVRLVHVDGGFDHWGDSTLNYLDDSAIGIDGGLPSADAYWEGVGRCALGPRTLR